METVVEVEGNDEAKLKECGIRNSTSSLSSPKQISDPVVYKLVRVNFLNISIQGSCFSCIIDLWLCIRYFLAIRFSFYSCQVKTIDKASMLW
jgi:hypothetical protein